MNITAVAGRSYVLNLGWPGTSTTLTFLPESSMSVPVLGLCEVCVGVSRLLYSSDWKSAVFPDWDGPVMSSVDC